jgi:hypothetical protein
LVRAQVELAKADVARLEDERYLPGTKYLSDAEALRVQNSAESNRETLEYETRKKAWGKEFKEAKDRFKRYNEILIESLKNKRVLIYLDVITADKNQTDMNQPITFAPIKQDLFDIESLDAQKKKLGLDLGVYVKDGTGVKLAKGIILDGEKLTLPDPIRDKIFRSTEVDVVTLLKAVRSKTNLQTNRNLDNYDDTSAIHKDVFMGATLVGLHANIMKVIAYVVYGGEHGKQGVDKKGNDVNYRRSGFVAPGTEGFSEFKINGVPFGEFTKYQKVAKELFNTDVNNWETSDSVLNGYIDNVKEQVTAILNASDETGGSIAILIHMGVPLNHIAMMVNHPGMLTSTGNENPVDVSTIDISIDKVIADIQRNDSNTHTGIAIRALFRNLKDYNEALSTVNKNVSSIKSLKVFYEDMKENQNATVTPEIIKSENLNEIPHIKKANEMNGWVLSMIDKLMPLYSDVINKDVVERLYNIFDVPETNFKLKKDLPEAIRNEFSHYIASAHADSVLTASYEDMIKPITVIGANDTAIELSGADAFLELFRQEVKELKKTETNKFINSFNTLKLDDVSNLYRLEYTSGTNLTVNEELRLKAAFSKLPRSTREKFLLYDLLSNGASFGFRGFSTVMSQDDLLEADISYNETLKNYISELQTNPTIINDFAIQLRLNRPERVRKAADVSPEFATLVAAREVASGLVLYDGKEYTQASRKLSPYRFQSTAAKISSTVDEETFTAVETSGKYVVGKSTPIWKSGVANTPAVVYLKFGERTLKTIKQVFVRVTNKVEKEAGETAPYIKETKYKMLQDTEMGSALSKLAKGAINVYWGQAETPTSTKLLSNLAPRRFTWEGKEYLSVEHAYQVLKSGTPNMEIDAQYRKLMLLSDEEVSKKSAGVLKRKAVVPMAQMVAADSLGLMEKLVVESFEQNADSAGAKLLAKYDNFTHNSHYAVDKAFLKGLRAAKLQLYPKADMQIKPYSANKLPKKVLTKMLDKLSKATGLPYSIDMDEYMQVMQELGTKLRPAGIFHKGKIYIDPSQAGMDTPLHEFAHPFVSHIKATRQVLYKRLAREIKKNNPEILAFVKKHYPNMSKEDQMEEAIVTAIGYVGTKKQGLAQTLIDGVKRFMRAIGKLFGIPTVNTMTLRDVAKAISRGGGPFTPDGDGRSKMSIKEGKDPIKVIQEANAAMALPEDNENSKHYVKDAAKLLRVGEVLKKVSTKKEIELDKWKATKEFENARLGVNDRITTLSENPMTYDETVKFYADQFENKRNYGKIAHAMIESLIHKIAGRPEQSSLASNEAQQRLDDSPAHTMKDFSHITREYVSKLLVRMEIDAKSDTLGTEIMLSLEAKGLFEEEMDGIGGTADLLVHHGNSVYTLADFKSSDRFGVDFSSFLFKHSKQFGWVLENDRNRAKMQLALYAIMLKSQDPNAKIKNMFAVGVGKKSKNVLTPSEFDTYIKIWDAYFKAENPEFHKENSQLFNYKNYLASNYTASADLMNMDKDMSDPVKRNTLIQKYLAELREHQEEHGELDQIKNPEVKDRVVQLTEAVAALMEGNKDIGKLSLKGMMGTLKRKFSSIYHATHPLLTSFTKLITARKQEVREEILEATERHNAKLDALLKSKGKTASVHGISPKEIYKFMWVDESDSSKDQVMVTRESPNWKSLSKAEKDYADYTRRELRYQLFATMDPAKGMELISAEILSMGKELSRDDRAELERQYSDLDRRPSTDKMAKEQPFFEYTDDWVPMIHKEKSESTFKERKERMIKRGLRGEARRLAGGFTYGETEYIEEYMTDSSTNRYFGVPLKYIADDSLRRNKRHSTNINYIFDSFVTSAASKRQLDDVYNYGKALKTFIGTKTNVENAAAVKLTTDWLDDAVTLHALNLKKKSGILGNPMEFTLLGRPMSMDKVINKLRQYTSFVGLGLKLTSGMRNGLVETLLNNLKGVENSISKKAGLDVEFTAKTITQAISDVTKFNAAQLAEIATGKKISGNSLKLRSVMNRYGFAGSSYDYTIDRDKLKVKKSSFMGMELPKWMNNSMFYKQYEVTGNINMQQLIVAQLRSMTPTLYKLDAKGKAHKVENKKTMWELLDENGKWKADGLIRGITPEGTHMTDLANHEIMKIKRVTQQIQGGYRDEERLMVEVTALGGLVMQFKKFAPELIRKTFAGKYEESFLGKWTESTEVDKVTGLPVLEWETEKAEGSARVFTRFVADFVKAGIVTSEAFSKTRVKANYTPSQQKAVIAASVRLTLMLAAAVTLSIAGIDDDDKDPVSKFWTYTANDLYWEYNPVEMMQLLDKPVAALPRVTEFIKGAKKFFIDSMLFNERIKSGENKGEWKGWRQMLKGVPLYSGYQDTKKTGFGLLGIDDKNV